MSDFTQDGWADQLRTFRKGFDASDDDLRSLTLSVIRSLARSGDLDGIRAALAALDEALAS